MTWRVQPAALQRTHTCPLLAVCAARCSSACLRTHALPRGHPPIQCDARRAWGCWRWGRAWERRRCSGRSCRRGLHPAWWARRPRCPPRRPPRWPGRVSAWSLGRPTPSRQRIFCLLQAQERCSVSCLGPAAAAAGVAAALRRHPCKAGHRRPPAPTCRPAAGIEYLTHGLATAALSHWLYDWWALVFVLQQWGGDGGESGIGGSNAAAARKD